MHIDLPLHGGKCPPWLFEKMTKLAQHFLILFVKERGVEELLNNLSHPLWFQSLGCYLGFDWHSSGLTTVIGGVLSEALKNINYEIGLYVAGGKGKTALKTPYHIQDLSWKYKILNPQNLIQASKIIAKTDNSLIQDGFSLYYHQIFFSNKGNYTIIQQGLNDNGKPTARRYHRNKKISTKLINLLKNKNNGLEYKDFNIISNNKLKKVLNLISVKSKNTRENILQIINYIQKNYKMPDHHIIKPTDFNIDKLVKTLTLIKQNLSTFYDLLNIKGIGPKAIFNLVQTSELIFGEEADWSDPARFSFTHGGKDGTPYKPYPEEFDETIYHLKLLINKAKQKSTAKNIYFYTKNNINRQKSLFDKD